MSSRYAPPAPQLVQARTAAGISAAIAFVVYLRTMLPGVSVQDWAEMQYIPAQLGIPHPTGFPLYVLAGKVFSLLPVGSYAFRAGLLSVAVAAAVVGVAALIAGRLGVRPLVAAAAALALAFSGTLWLEATFPEMNGLHVLLVGLVVHRALVWRAERRDRDLLLGALLSGLAFSNHLLAATTVPIVVVFILWDARQRLRERPALLLQAALLFVVGLTPYLFIPLRALAGPPEVYGHLTTLDGLVTLITGSEYHGTMNFLSADSLAAAGQAIPTIVPHLVGRSSPLFIVAAVVGLGLLARRDRWLAAILLLLAASGIYFLANYVTDFYHYLLVAWLVLAIGFAVAGEWLVGRLEGRFGPGGAAAQVLLLLLPLSIVLQQWPVNDQSRNEVGERLSEKVFSLLPQDAVLVTYWDLLTTMSYKHCMEGVRPDVTLLAHDPPSRVTCDRATEPLEDQVRRGQQVYVLFARWDHYEPFRRSFDLVPGPTLDLPYGQRYLDHQGTLDRLELIERAEG